MNYPSNESRDSSPEQRLNELNRQYKARIVSGYKFDELKSLKEAIRKVQIEIERKVAR